jgi:hypothetical protein
MLQTGSTGGKRQLYSDHRRGECSTKIYWFKAYMAIDAALPEVETPR